MPVSVRTALAADARLAEEQLATFRVNIKKRRKTSDISSRHTKANNNNNNRCNSWTQKCDQERK